MAKAKILEHRIDQLERQQVADHEENREAHKSFYERLEACEKNQAVIKTEVLQTAANTGEIKEMVSTLSDKINEILQKPAKRWEYFITAVIGIVAGFVLRSIGIF